MYKIISVKTKTYNAFEKSKDFLKYMEIANDFFSYPNDRERIYESNSRHWETYGYGMKNKTLPCYAMKSLFKNEAYMDCGRTALSVLLRVALENTSDLNFNSLFMKSGIRIRAVTPFNSRKQNFNGLIKTVLLDSEKDIQVGDWLFLETTDDYLDKNPNGYFTGEHVVAVTKSKRTCEMMYSGFLGESNIRNYREWKSFLANEIDEKDSDIKGFFTENGKIVARRIDLSSLNNLDYVSESGNLG